MRVLAQGANVVDLGWAELIASFSLIAVAVGISLWLRLRLAWPILEASLRALVQLALVGVLFNLIFEAGGAHVFAWAWVLAMVAITVVVVSRRAPAIPDLWRSVLVAVLLSTGVALGLIFGLGVFEHEPVTVVVMAGITLGNVLPSAVLAAKQVEFSFIDGADEVEALLALGFDTRGATRFIGPRAARTALVVQIERTKVVGLVALPGAMTGLLLAGVEPMDAVLVQLVVMYLVLGATVIVVTSIIWSASRSAFTADLRLAPWTMRERTIRDPT
ncbi:MAG: ABC transporter permease [Acidimicrobiales bacterium]